jgi:S1-C subfamily serine protease
MTIVAVATRGDGRNGTVGTILRADRGREAQQKADAKERPGDFTTRDRADRRLLVFEREETAPANPADGAAAYAGVQLRADAEAKAVVVATPIKGSPAEKAGLKKGDVILMVGATEATDLEATVKAVRQARPGDKVEFRIRRDGKESTIAVAVGVLPFHWVAGLD